MRVIAGSAKRIQLKTLDGLDTRPTTDRIKETLFNMIAPTIYDSVFLDLFGGSGGIGIEALSRGAREAVFVENNPKAMACIKENLKNTRLEAKALTLTRDVMAALYQLEGDKVFDFIYMDPPYDRELENGCWNISPDPNWCMRIPSSSWRPQEKQIFPILKAWDFLCSKRKSIKRTNMSSLKRPERKKYVKSYLPGEL